MNLEIYKDPNAIPIIVILEHVMKLINELALDNCGTQTEIIKWRERIHIDTLPGPLYVYKERIHECLLSLRLGEKMHAMTSHYSKSDWKEVKEGYVEVGRYCAMSEPEETSE